MTNLNNKNHIPLLPLLIIKSLYIVLLLLTIALVFLLSTISTFAITSSFIKSSSEPSSVSHSIVPIYSFKHYATAFYIGEGRFVTNFHVIVPTIPIIKKEILYDKKKFTKAFILYGNQKIYFTKILHLDAVNDLAVLKVSAKDILLLEQTMQALTISNAVTTLKQTKYQLISIDYSEVPYKLIQLQLFIPSNKVEFIDNSLQFNSSYLKFGMSGAPLLSHNQVIGILHNIKNLIINRKPTVRAKLIPVSHLFTLLKTKPLTCDFLNCITLEINNILSKAYNNNLKAQYTLGTIYYYGDGINQNLKEAAFWYEVAAKQGNKKSQYILSYMYFRGKGVNQNLIIAMYWQIHYQVIKFLE